MSGADFGLQDWARGLLRGHLKYTSSFRPEGNFLVFFLAKGLATPSPRRKFLKNLPLRPEENVVFIPIHIYKEKYGEDHNTSKKRKLEVVTLAGVKGYIIEEKYSEKVKIVKGAMRLRMVEI